MRCCIPALNQKPGRIHKPEVCLPTLLGVYGFSEYDWRTCSQAVKSNPTGRVASLHHKVWKDDNLPEHSYAEMELVFRENLSISNSGKQILLLLLLLIIITNIYKPYNYTVNPRMIRAALTPMAETQMVCRTIKSALFHR